MIMTQIRVVTLACLCCCVASANNDTVTGWEVYIDEVGTSTQLRTSTTVIQNATVTNRFDYDYGLHRGATETTSVSTTLVPNTVIDTYGATWRRSTITTTLMPTASYNWSVYFWPRPTSRGKHRPAIGKIKFWNEHRSAASGLPHGCYGTPFNPYLDDSGQRFVRPEATVDEVWANSCYKDRNGDNCPIDQHKLVDDQLVGWVPRLTWFPGEMECDSSGCPLNLSFEEPIEEIGCIAVFADWETVVAVDLMRVQDDGTEVCAGRFMIHASQLGMHSLAWLLMRGSSTGYGAPPMDCGYPLPSQSGDFLPLQTPTPTRRPTSAPAPTTRVMTSQTTTSTTTTMAVLRAEDSDDDDQTLPLSTSDLMLLIMAVLMCFTALLSLGVFGMHRYESNQTKLREDSELEKRLGKLCPAQVWSDATLDEEEPSKACAICLVDLAIGDQVRTLPCSIAGHTFHKDCIDGWYLIKRPSDLEANFAEEISCPMCRAVIRLSDALDIAQPLEVLHETSEARVMPPEGAEIIGAATLATDEEAPSVPVQGDSAGQPVHTEI